MNIVEVVDVPQGTPENTAREMLNRPCTENRYMLVQALLMPDGATRAIYRLLARAYDKTQGARSVGGNWADKDGKDGAAREIIEANLGSTVRSLVGLLAEHGIKRGRTWVCEARIKTRMLDARCLND